MNNRRPEHHPRAEEHFLVRRCFFAQYDPVRQLHDPVRQLRKFSNSPKIFAVAVETRGEDAARKRLTRNSPLRSAEVRHIDISPPWDPATSLPFPRDAIDR